MTTNRDAVYVLAESLAKTAGWNSAPGPAINEHAERQLAALEQAGYVVVRRFDLSRLVSFVLQFTSGFDLNARRARTLLGTLRTYLPPSEDDDA